MSLIVRNGIVHTLAAPAKFFTEPYWRDPFPAALYRPLATTALALQWAIGEGSPVPYRIASGAMLLGAGLALLRMASLLLPRAAAWTAAALFMVHPVHVEAVAPAVNQGELMVGLLLTLATVLYIRARCHNLLGPSTLIGLILLYLSAALFKEHALVLPALLFAAEVTVIRDPMPLRARIAALRPLYLSFGLVAAAVLAVRTLVVGDTVGTPTAEQLMGAGMGGRLLTMLGVIPEWARLLLWPAHLQADYGPNEISAASGWGAAQTGGTLILAVAIGLLFWSRQRMPVVAFGVMWAIVALLPVSNVLVPTGIVLAERTVFLASVGAALAAGGLFNEFWKRAYRRSPMSWMAYSVVGLLVALGLARTVSRLAVWRTQETLLRHTVVDAPRSYRAHLAITRFLEDSGATTDAAAHYRKAVDIMPKVQDRERLQAELYAQAGYCGPAMRHYRRALLIAPSDSALQQRLASCLSRQIRDDNSRNLGTADAPTMNGPGRP